mmetsp:Transcript_59083/g.137560  ORF Transcript_59083/g.137560 Transcript_59083/m.137560 type:complete len:530 (-) Transcript_59083:151-1740(-)
MPSAGVCCCENLLAAFQPQGRKGLKRITKTFCQEGSNTLPLIDRLKKAQNPYREVRASYDTSTVEHIGHGSFGSVHKVVCKVSGCARAVKQITKLSVDSEAIRMELQILLELDHPNIIRLSGWYEDDFSVYLVTELANGGCLKSRSPCEAPEAAQLFSQLVRAVTYLHARCIVHRDLKAQNCLLTGDLDAPVVKVIDFGLAMVKRSGGHDEWLSECVGTRSHMAPEVLDTSRRYGLKCDVWSAGIILHTLLTGAEPYPHGFDEQSELVFDDTCVKPEAQDLVEKMLQRDPDQRPDMQEVQQHSWLATAQQWHLDRKVLKRVRAWSQSEASPFRQAVATATAHTVEDEDLADARATFMAIDTGSGVLEKQAIGEAYRKCGLALAEDELNSIVTALGSRGGESSAPACVAWTAWLTAALHPDMIASEDHLKRAMACLDGNTAGAVSPGLLSKVLGGSVAEDAFLRWDHDGDHVLKLAEVKTAMEGVAAQKALLAQSPAAAPAQSPGRARPWSSPASSQRTTLACRSPAGAV